MITLTAGSGKGGETDTRTGFSDAVLKCIAEISGPLIIAGPGFIKDDFVRYAKNKNSAPAGQAIVVETRRIGRGAVQDVIGSGTLEKLMGDLQLSREVKLMDEVLLRIAQDGAVAYGKKPVESAIEVRCRGRSIARRYPDQGPDNSALNRECRKDAGKDSGALHRVRTRGTSGRAWGHRGAAQV